MSKSSKFIRDWKTLQYNQFLMHRDAKKMKIEKPPITVSSAKSITIKDATLRERELLDNRTKDAKAKTTIEAFVVNDPPMNGNEVIYS